MIRGFSFGVTTLRSFVNSNHSLMPLSTTTKLYPKAQPGHRCEGEDVVKKMYEASRSAVFLEGEKSKVWHRVVAYRQYYSPYLLMISLKM